MARYVLIFHGAKRPQGEAEFSQAISAWNQWLAGLGRAVVDGGGPFSQARQVSTNHVIESAQHDHPSGYTVLEAANMTEAVDMTKRCPVLKVGGTVEVCEAFQIL